MSNETVSAPCGHPASELSFDGPGQFCRACLKASVGGLAMKQKEGKLRYDLVPPIAHEDIVRVFTYGAKKYEAWNWAKGMPWGDAIASLERHVAEFKKGVNIDPESGLPHLAHAAWWCIILLEYVRLGIGEDNRLTWESISPQAKKRALAFVGDLVRENANSPGIVPPVIVGNPVAPIKPSIVAK